MRNVRENKIKQNKQTCPSFRASRIRTCRMSSDSLRESFHIPKQTVIVNEKRKGKKERKEEKKKGRRGKTFQHDPEIERKQTPTQKTKEKRKDENKHNNTITPTNTNTTCQREGHNH